MNDENLDDYKLLQAQKRFLGEIEQGIRLANRELIHKKIAIIPTKNAYLPDIDVYKKLFSKYSLNVEVIHKPDKIILKDFHVIWRFMGVDTIYLPSNNQLLFHEYQSGSVNPFPRFKNKIKKMINLKPDIRIFQSQLVEKSFSFNDSIKTFFRPMGFSKDFLLDKVMYEDLP